MTILLGTVALEPNRWRRGPAIDLAPYLDGIADAGFDGIELWERHLSDAVLDHPVPIAVFNTYASLDDADPQGRQDVAARVRRAGSGGVKFNVGNDHAMASIYAERIAAWLSAMPEHVVLLCECHAGISIAEDPKVAAAIFDAAGPADRVGAIVHTHEDPDHLRTRFDVYGDRVRHVHVNFLDDGAPRLVDVRSELETKVALLQSLGFDGSWTIEFVHGVLTDRDHPEPLLEQAVEDLAVLRAVLS